LSKLDLYTVRLLHRDGLIKTVSSHILHMQKVLTQMNLQIHNVISDITGVTGLAIIDAVLSGERNPQKHAALKNGAPSAITDTAHKLAGRSNNINMCNTKLENQLR